MSSHHRKMMFEGDWGCCPNKRIGAKRMHFGAAIQIQSFLSAQKDAGVDAAYQPDHIIRELPELVDYLEERNRAERLTMQ